MTATRVWTVEESLEFPGVPPEAVYGLLADVRRMKEFSPEVIGIWRRGRNFVGFNRRAAWIWFTTCRIAVDESDREFAFDVTTFGLPIARWGYRLEPLGHGTLVTEYWIDHRRGGAGARTAETLGLVFSGTPAGQRAEHNRAGMRTTLQRLRAACLPATA
ncbi:SRPBCC family protein [Kitasatospora sp. NPDC085879]|uniref:SRPBCC family protein n=1 Tax=Kitasatospora sp. NPDC085879 TaxID=3154769 RepID=UPI00341268D8